MKEWCEFKDLCDMVSEYGDVYYTEDRWFSHGRILKRFYDVLKSDLLLKMKRKAL
jgi:hypothetical protein